MISYHRTHVCSGAAAFSRDFQNADTNDVRRITNCARRFVWSPIIWKDGIRRQDNFIRADWLVLDFDTGEFTLLDAFDTFCDHYGFIGVTKSHQKEKNGFKCDRFRVAILFQKTITDLRIYRWNMYKWLTKYPCDRSCKDGARFFYPCADINSIWDHPDMFKAEIDYEVPDDFENYYSSAKAQEYIRTGILPEWFKAKFSIEYPKGERNTRLYGVAKDLFRFGRTKEQTIELINSHKTVQLADAHFKRIEVPSLINSAEKKHLEEIKRGK